MSERALTIRAPWAWAIAYADKRIENRSWSTRYRGTLFIHAGSRDDRKDRDSVERILGRPLPTEIPRGAIVARATLVNVVEASQVEDSAQRRRWLNGRYAWLLEDVETLEPRPMPGKLRLWTIAQP